MEAMSTKASGLGAKITAAFNGASAASFALAKGFGIIAAAAGGIAAYAIKGASDLEFQLNLLQTHAGFAQNDTVAVLTYQKAQAALGNNLSLANAQLGYQNQQVAALRSGLLALAPQVGYTATEMAQAAYYASSEGLQFRNATDLLNLMSAAAKTAQMTHSDLGATTKTLAQIMSVFASSFSDPNRAAGELNAIVGQGVMTMDQFSSSLKTGFLGVTGAIHQSLSEMGGFLDILTTGAYGAGNATTALRYSLVALTNQTTQHEKAFQALGLDQAKFVQMMVTDPNGYLKGLELLKQKLSGLPGGIGGATSLSIIDKMFGGVRGAAAAQTIFGALDKVKAAIADINQNADTFNQKWSQTAKQPTVMFAMFRAAVSSLRIALGEALIPMFTSLLTAITPVVVKLGEWIGNNQKLIETWAPIILKILLAATAFFTLSGAAFKFLAFISMLNPMRILLLAVVAVLVFMVEHWKQWGPVIGGVANAISNGLKPALTWLVNFVTGPVASAFGKFGGWVLGTLVPVFERAGPKIREFLGGLGQGAESIWKVFVAALPDIEKFFTVMVSAIAEVFPFVGHLIAAVVILGAVIINILRPVMTVLEWLQEHFHAVTIVLDAIIARYVLMHVLNPFLGGILAAKTFIGHLTSIRGLMDFLLGRQLTANLFGGPYQKMVAGTPRTVSTPGLFGVASRASVAEDTTGLSQVFRAGADVSLATRVQAGWSSIASLFDSVETRVVAAASGMATGVAGAFEGMSSEIGMGLSRVAFGTAGILENLSSTVPLALSKMAFVSGAVLTNLTVRASSVATAVAGLFSRMASSVTLMLSRLAFVSGALLNNIVDAISGREGGFLRTATGPVTLDVATTDATGQLGRVQTAFADLRDFASSRLSEIETAFSSAFSRMGTIAVRAAGVVTRSWATLTGPVVSAASRASSMLEAGFIAAGSRIGAVFSGLSSTVVGAFSRMSTTAQGIASDLSSRLSSIFSRSVPNIAIKATIGTTAATDFTSAVAKANIGAKMATDFTESVSRSSVIGKLFGSGSKVEAATSVLTDSSGILSRLFGAGGKVLGTAGKAAQFLAQPVFVVNWPSSFSGPIGSSPLSGPEKILGGAGAGSLLSRLPFIGGLFSGGAAGAAATATGVGAPFALAALLAAGGGLLGGWLGDLVGSKVGGKGSTAAGAGSIIGTIGGATAVGAAAGLAGGPFAPVTVPVGAAIGAVVGSAIVIFEHLGQVIGGLGTAATAVGGFFHDLPGHLMDIGKTVLGGVGDFFKGVGGFFHDLPGHVADFFTSIPGAIGGAFGHIADFFAHLPSPAQMGYAVGSFLHALPGRLADGYQFLSDHVGGFFRGVGGFFHDLFAGSSGKRGGIVSAVGGFFGRIGGFFHDLPGHVANFFKSIPGAAADLFRKIGGFFHDLPGHIAEFFKSIPGALGNFFGGVRDFFVALPGRIAGFFTTVFGAVGNFLGAIGNFFHNVVGWVGGLFSTVWNAIVGVFKAIAGFFHDLPGHIADFFKGAYQALSDHVGGFLSGVWAGITGQSAPKREHGGPVEAGKPYIVGERRPELFVPKASGTILPTVPAGFSRTAGHLDHMAMCEGGAVRARDGAKMNIIGMQEGGQVLRQHETVIRMQQGGFIDRDTRIAREAGAEAISGRTGNQAGLNTVLMGLQSIQGLTDRGKGFELNIAGNIVSLAQSPAEKAVAQRFAAQTTQVAIAFQATHDSAKRMTGDAKMWFPLMSKYDLSPVTESSISRTAAQHTLFGAGKGSDYPRSPVIERLQGDFSLLSTLALMAWKANQSVSRSNSMLPRGFTSRMEVPSPALTAAVSQNATTINSAGNQAANAWHVAAQTMKQVAGFHGEQQTWVASLPPATMGPLDLLEHGSLLSLFFGPVQSPQWTDQYIGPAISEYPVASHQFGARVPASKDWARAGAKVSRPTMFEAGEAHETEWIIPRHKAGPYTWLLDRMLSGTVPSMPRFYEGGVVTADYLDAMTAMGGRAPSVVRPHVLGTTAGTAVGAAAGPTVRSTLDDIHKDLVALNEAVSKTPASTGSHLDSVINPSTTGLGGLLYQMNQKARRNRSRGMRTERFG